MPCLLSLFLVLSVDVVGDLISLIRLKRCKTFSCSPVSFSQKPHRPPEPGSGFAAATNPRLIPARTKMILAISNMLRTEGVLYTMPPMAQKEGGTTGTSILDKGGAQDMGLVSQMGIYNLMPQVLPVTL